jgi:hypothetical protein
VSRESHSVGVPTYKEVFFLTEVMYVRHYGLGIDIRDKHKNVTFEIPDAKEWSERMNEAVEVLTSSTEKLQLASAKNEFRMQEMEERRKANEERKRQLTDNGRLGMRFTAEVMAQENGNP